MDLPVCEVCGRLVTVVRTAEGYAAWCGCEATAPSDPRHRGVGRGATEGEAVEAWEKWKR
jgi:hypothetical protein